jgi:cell division protease FtsH
VSEETSRAIDREVKEIVDEAHKQALDLLNNNRDLLETITAQLLETEVIEGETLYSLLKQVKAKPEMAPQAALV